MTPKRMRAEGPLVNSSVDRRSWGILARRRSAKSLWTVPELWKTQTARFPQLVGRRPERAAHNGPQGFLYFAEEEQMRKMTRLTTGGARH
jgi:hypothetical protein